MKMFLIGLYVAFSLVAIVFFIRFWRDTRDKLFLQLAMAFTILAAERTTLLVISVPREASSFIYVLRLVAFSIVIWALVDKNKRPKIRGNH